MKLELVQFLCNSPVEVSLLTLSPTPKEGPAGLKYFYPLSDGRGMWADAELHRKIQLFEPAADQKFFICKRRAHGKKRIWDLWRGAAVGANEQAIKPEDGRLVLELARSLDRIPPKPAPQPIPIRSETTQPLATGTYGPKPAPAIPQRTGRIPLNTAVAEIIGFTTEALKQTGQQWSENSIQDLVSTVIIAATKAGYTTLWER